MTPLKTGFNTCGIIKTLRGIGLQEIIGILMSPVPVLAFYAS